MKSGKRIAALILATGLASLVSVTVQADWAVSMSQTNLNNMSYSAFTQVGVSSFCAYEGVCDGDGGEHAEVVEDATGWMDAAERAAARNIEPTDLSFGRNAEITALVEQDILSAVQQQDQTAAAELEAVFAEHDFVVLFGEVMSEYGLEALNLADSFAAYSVLMWLVANGTPAEERFFPKPEEMQGMRDQFRLALAANPGVHTLGESGRQLFAESVIYNYFILAAAWEQASAPGNEAMLSQLAEAWHGHAGLWLGADPHDLRLTSVGFAQGGPHPRAAE